MKTVGRPRNLVRQAWLERMNLSYSKPRTSLPDRFLLQLSMCRSDETRRLLLGISEKEEVKPACTA